MADPTELTEENLEVIRAITEAKKEQNKEREKSIALNTVAVQNARENLEFAQMNLELQQKTNNATEEEIEALKEKLGAAQKYYNTVLKAQTDLNKIADKTPDVLKSIFSGDADKLASRGISNLSGKIENKLVKSMKSAAGSAETFGAGLKAMAGPAVTLAIFLLAAEALKLAVELGNAENAFMKTTGANEDFARSLSVSFQETRKFGATTQETSAAMTSLFMSFTDFTFQNEKTRESLTNTATVLAKLGVSSDDFSKSIQNMTKAMGMNAEGAAQQLLNLEKFAEELGVAPSKIASDFAGAGGQLAKFGDQGVQAFKDLQIASKITGLEMQRILNITEKFDTFEGAAIQAGKLNAALGGNFVNAMDLMMTTDPVERFDQIRGAILNAGLSFDEMSYYQRNFYKEALGLSDVSELALILSGRTDLLSESFDKSSQSYEDAAERAKTVASFQEQLNMLFVELIPIVTPVIAAIRSFISALQPLAPILGGIGDVFKFIFEGMGIFYTFFGDLYSSINESLPIFRYLGRALAIIGIGFAVYLGGPIAIVAGLVLGLVSAFGYLIDMIFHVSNSPTFFEGLSMMPEMFSDLGGEIEVTSKSMQGMGKTMESTPIPAAAETLAGTTNSGTNESFAGGDAGMQTVRQPMEISLNGDKLEKFIVEVMGANIKKISILQ